MLARGDHQCPTVVQRLGDLEVLAVLGDQVEILVVVEEMEDQEVLEELLE